MTSATPEAGTVHVSGWDGLDVRTAYALLRLRVDVFVVEQRCSYPELDGRDLEPGTEHRWLTDDDGGQVLGYLRVLSGGDAGGGDGEPSAPVRRIGRVVTAPHARGRGVSATLVNSVVRDHGGHELRLEAQAHLVGWYARFGFCAVGEQYDDEGIPHVPMGRAGRAR